MRDKLPDSFEEFYPLESLKDKNLASGERDEEESDETSSLDAVSETDINSSPEFPSSEGGTTSAARDYERLEKGWTPENIPEDPFTSRAYKEAKEQAMFSGWYSIPEDQGDNFSKFLGQNGSLHVSNQGVSSSVSLSYDHSGNLVPEGEHAHEGIIAALHILNEHDASPSSFFDFISANDLSEDEVEDVVKAYTLLDRVTQSDAGYNVNRDFLGAMELNDRIDLSDYGRDIY